METMKEITQFESHTVEIWRRPRQRHMHLRVRPDGHIRVTCSRRVPKNEIFLFIREQEHFIKKCLAGIAEHKRKHPAKTFQSGEAFFFLGERVPLQLVWSWNSKIRVELRAGEIEMVAPLTSTREERGRALHQNFRTLGRVHLKKRLEHFARVMGLQPATVAIRGQTTRWGSCSARGEISLNWKLMAAPLEVIDYVLVHELAHLRHLNHSPRFWSLVASHFPEFERAKAWLRAHEAEIAVQFAKI